MSFREMSRIKNDLISKMNTVGMELRGYESTLSDLQQNLYSTRKKIDSYRPHLARSTSKAVRELHEKAMNVFKEEEERLAKQEIWLQDKISEISIIHQELREEIRSMVG